MQHDPDSNNLASLLSRLNVIQVRGILQNSLNLSLVHSPMYTT